MYQWLLVEAEDWVGGGEEGEAFVVARHLSYEGVGGVVPAEVEVVHREVRGHLEGEAIIMVVAIISIWWLILPQ